MTQNYNPLTFYESASHQDHKKRWGSNGYRLIANQNYIPAFQVPKVKNGLQLTKCDLYDANTDAPHSILLPDMTTKGLTVLTNAAWDYDIIYWDSAQTISGTFEGSFYLYVTDGNMEYYSEVFSFCDVTDMIEIEYWHCEDFIYPIGHIQYPAGYRSKFYLKTDIGKPKYLYEDKIQKRAGYNYPTDQISYKLHRFNCLLPEPAIDAFRLIRLHDNITIKYKGHEYTVMDFLMENPKWLNKGDLASVNVEFKTDMVVQIQGRAYETCEPITEGIGIMEIGTDFIIS